MNKFTVFFTVLVTLAILPSNLGLPPFVRGLMGPSDEITGGFKGQRSTGFHAWNGIVGGNQGSISKRGAANLAELLDLMVQGFTICNVDDVPGLSWSEINDCRVKQIFIYL